MGCIVSRSLEGSGALAEFLHLLWILGTHLSCRRKRVSSGLGLGVLALVMLLHETPQGRARCRQASLLVLALLNPDVRNSVLFAISK